MYVDSIVAGDFNLDLLKIDSRNSISDYIELMYSYSYLPSITLPTRLTRRNATLIDQIFYKSSASNVQGGIILNNISDHLMTFICVDLQQTSRELPKTVSFQKCDNNSINNFVNAIENIDFSAHISNSPDCNPDTNFQIIKTLIDNCISHHLPFRTVKFNRYQHKINPWITNGILKSIKNRDKMYKEMKVCNPNSQEYDRLKRNVQSYNNLIKKLIRCSKQSYYNNLFLKHKNDSRKSWKLLNSLLGTSNKRNNLTNIFVVNGSLTSNEAVIADNLNKFFSNIGNQYASAIPQTDPNAFMSYLTNPTNCRF